MPIRRNRVIKGKARVASKGRKATASLLPTEPLSSTIQPSRLVILTIAPPKWGKTEFAMSNPETLLLAFEEGHTFQRGFKMVIDCWDSRGTYKNFKDDDGVMHCTAQQALQALQDDDTDRYKMVAIDTVDMAGKQCSDYHCDRAGVEHISELGDFGKGYDIGLNTPMRQFIMGILKTGRGVILITHSKTVIEKFTSGEKARKEMSLGKGLRSLCESQADIIMHGELGKKRPGKRRRDRIFVTEGDMDTLAGSRVGDEVMLPERYIVSDKDAWKQFERFFSDPKAAEKAELFYKKVMRSKHK